MVVATILVGILDIVIYSALYLSCLDALNIAVDASKPSISTNLDWVILFDFSKINSIDCEYGSAINRAKHWRVRSNIGIDIQNQSPSVQNSQLLVAEMDLILA